MVLIPWSRTRSPRDERGAVLVLVAILAIVLFIVSALVVDLGMGRAERRTVQATADASALAGGNVLFAANPTTPDYNAARDAVKSYATQNLGLSNADWASCSDSTPLPISSGTPCISFEVTASRARVRVVIPTRTVGTSFARVIGVNELAVSATARATIERDSSSDCGLCVLGSGSTHDIQNGDVTVTGADIHFNGNVNASANGLVATNGEITVEGTATGPSSSYQPAPATGVSAIADPLEDYYERPDMTGLTAGSDPCTSGPGIYGDLTVNGGTCNLSPGLYVITGLWKMGGSGGTIAGTGVTLFFACGTTSSVTACAQGGEDGGTIDTGGNGVLSITAPTTGTYKGMALWFDRNNTEEAHLHGNGLGAFSGTIYGQSIELRMSGNGCSNTNALIIVKDLGFDGNPSCLTSTYVQGANVQLPPNNLHLDQ